MKNIAIYPYNHDVDTLLDYKGLLYNYNISGFTSFKEHHILVKQLQKKYKLNESDDLNQILDYAQSLLLCDPIGDYLSERYAAWVKEANKRDIEILLTSKLYEMLQKRTHGLNSNNILSNEYKMLKHYEEKQLFHISVPAIAIAGLGENCSKFEMQILIKKVVSDMGYQSINMCTNPLGSLFGMYLLPEFLFQKEFSFQEKIIHFNHYIYDLCKTQKPDVIIIGLPSGVMPLGENVFNYFSEIPLIISNALNFDLGLLNLYYSPNIDLKYLENLRNYCHQKYSLEITAFCLARQKVEYCPGENKFEFYFLNDNFIKKSFPNLSKGLEPIINLVDRIDSEQMIQTLIQLLEQNLNVV